MRIYSLAKQNHELQPVEIEISLMPGLPKIHFLGQPDSLIKESELRIRSAIRHQGYDLPKAKQILIHLKPNHIKKTSRGLDLAIALAILWKTEQLEFSEDIRSEGKVLIYGELSLAGKVMMPKDLDEFSFSKSSVLITGKSHEYRESSYYALETLGAFQELEFCCVDKTENEFKRPRLNQNLVFNKETAELLSVAALGEHSLMLAGPAGVGKTTLAESIHQLLRDPDKDDFLTSKKIARMTGKDLSWRPFVSPHHSTTPLSMIGGGRPIFPGEITRAHAGVLLLDEYLEFQAKVQEALREPMEKGEIHISRFGEYRKFPADFMLLATTNLCPCGDLVPGERSNCQRSLTRCRVTIERMSGPVLDRFEILALMKDWKKDGTVRLEDIYKNLEKIRSFVKTSRETVLNSKMLEEDIVKSCDGFVKNVVLNELEGSRRRGKSLLSVARSFADLDQSELIKPCHIEKSMQLTVTPFGQIKKIFG